MAVVDDMTIYTDDPPPLPSCCATRPARASGGLILGGSARVLVPALPVVAAGGLVLGGSGIVTQPSDYAGLGRGGLLLGGSGVGARYAPARASGGLILEGLAVATGRINAIARGGLVLGGSGVGVHYPPAVGVGGLVLGGSGVATGPQPSPSGSGGGGEETMGCEACPDGAALDWIVHIQGVTDGSCADCAALNGDWPLTWTGGCAWGGSGMGVCGPVSDSYEMLIGNGTVTVNLPFAAYIGDAVGWDCKSPLTLSNVGQTGHCHWPTTITVEPAP